jgi:hypothetical protein
MPDRLTVILPPAASAEELAVAEFEFHCGNLAHGNGRGAGCYHGPTGWGDGWGSGYGDGHGHGWGDGASDGYRYRYGAGRGDGRSSTDA